MNPEEFLKNGKVIVQKPVFDVVKSKRTYRNAFTNIIDQNETTVIIDQAKYDRKDAVEVEPDWKLLTFDMVLPFELVGFLAVVAKVLADAGISIFAVSAYSTDHILIKKDTLSRAKKVLENLGCVVEG
ncbi:ACT domain-containing protein [Candidatus Woesearchaeota archaeon]|nr:ACT domain-containing protein [Candidatus Woesearchaeota archaeon]